MLRAARELLEGDDVSTRRVGSALTRLQDLLPPGRPLSAVQLTALGGRVLVREGERLWDPDTGQLHVPGLEDGPDAPGTTGAAAGDGAPRAEVLSLEEAAAAASTPDRRAADDWFDRGVELEDTDPGAARTAYRRALEIDRAFADAYVNLGRLLHEAGELDEAELQYRAALAARTGHARAWYNLGVLLEDRDRGDLALEAYAAALEADPGLAVAHWNAARLHERAGREAPALRHLSAYKRLVEGRGV